MRRGREGYGNEEGRLNCTNCIWVHVDGQLVWPIRSNIHCSQESRETTWL